MAEPRVGSGFDAHQRDAARPLWLGGVLFDGEAGLAGHSDGDAVCHALADALLGAAALGDIGQHFPDTSPEIAGISGGELLSRIVILLRDAGFSPVACDVTILCATPMIGPHRDRMRRVLAQLLEVPIERVSVKGTRPEGLGLSGDGIGCWALATIR